MPTVRPAKSWPSQPSGSHVSHRPSFASVVASRTCRNSGSGRRRRRRWGRAPGLDLGQQLRRGFHLKDLAQELTDAVEVLLVVDPIFDFVAFAIDFARLGPVALDVAVDVNLDHLVRREEAVMDALLQRIGEDRLAEIVGVGDIFGFLRCGGEADLRRAGKMRQDFPPGRILGRAAAMTLKI